MSGSLALERNDKSHFLANNISFNFNLVTKRDLVVQLTDMSGSTRTLRAPLPRFGQDSSTLLSAVPSPTCGSRTNTSDTLVISIPWKAFDLVYVPDGASSSMRYLPIRQAINLPEHCTLGRAFLQEAYNMVDYEHENPLYIKHSSVERRILRLSDLWRQRRLLPKTRPRGPYRWIRPGAIMEH